MGEVSSFWAGAQDHQERVNLAEVVRGAGGWAALLASPRDALRGAGLPWTLVEAWLNTPERSSMGRAICLDDPSYPEVLRNTRNPPPVLFVEGDPDAMRAPCVAVVGTRRCTTYGTGIARQLGSALGEAGVTVVSGLARGIDAHAHEGALRTGRTVAVVAHGLSHTAPPHHVDLRRRIVGEGGAVVSVWPDALPPRPHTFPKRNTWIAGLSNATVVVEAGRRSGALITARAAIAEGRDVVAVPGPLGAPASEGCLNLIADGAFVLRSVRSFVEGLVDHRLPVWEPWLAALFAGASLDEVARRFERPIAAMAADLAQRELAGQVVRLPGQRYAPAGRRP